jgi:hypothetical protein
LGFGQLALADLLTRTLAAEGTAGGQFKLHHPAKADHVIFLFMHGGPSTIDLFDYKPKLAELNGQPLPIAKPRIVFAKTGNLLQSPWKFQQHGRSGAWVSELMPHLSRMVDDVCFVKSLYGTNPSHAAAVQKLVTGSATFVRPSMGSWIVYGLGQENQNLPGFISICPDLQSGFSSSAFLPASFAGAPLGKANCPVDQITFRDTRPAHADPAAQARFAGALEQANRRHLAAVGPDRALEARIASAELAFRMQAEAPRAVATAEESRLTRELYGLDNAKTSHFGYQCLMARRLVERGVRFVQCTHTYKWDAHSNLQAGHAEAALEVDQPVAALIQDLKQRGLLERTLVVWAGEFGRTPTAEGNDGRDHNPEGFTIFLAGGGIKPGTSYGATDDFGYYAAQDKVSVHDLHATILHLLGLNHERLTFRYVGRDFRLTDVEGQVIHQIIG